MATWTAYPYPAAHHFDAAGIKKNWARLHRGDAEPLPSDPQLLAAWALFHSGEFWRAAQAGEQLGPAGFALASKATCVQAAMLEKKEKTRLDLFMEVARRAEAQAARDTGDANAWYWQAYALGRYSQGISVAKALALGMGAKVKSALERTIELRPAHADAHIALGTFHAEVIHKVGALIGGMTYGARKDAGLSMFQAGLALHPESPIAMIEYANGMVMLEGDRRMLEATALYERAAACEPVDAATRLDVEMAKAALVD